MSVVIACAVSGFPTPTRDAVRDAAAALLLMLLAFAWSGGNLVLAFSSSPGTHQDLLVASSAPAGPVGPEASLTQAELAGAFSQAKADWLAVRPSADLSAVSVDIADLPGLDLGAQSGNAVTIDVDAAGWGWQAMDLPTVVRHEIGHVLGLEHGTGLMSASLAPGETRGVGAEYAEPSQTTDSSETTETTEPPVDPTDTTDQAGLSSTSGGAGSPDGESATKQSPAPGTTDPAESDVEPMTMPEPVGGTDSSGLTTKGLDTSEFSTESLELSAAPQMMTMAFGIMSAGGTTGADVITVVDNGDGTYSLQVGGVPFATLSGDSTATVDGLDGDDVLVGPDVASVWRITGINSGTLELPNGAKVEFSNVESLTGAATADDEFRFDPKAGLTGAVDDGAGQLTMSVAGFVRVKGDYGFERDAAYQAHVSNGSLVTGNLLKLGGTSGDGFVGVEVLGSSIGISGVLTNFTLAVVTAAEQAWHAASGTMATPTAQLGLGDLGLGLDSLTVSVNTTSADGTYLNLSANQISSASSTLVLNMASALTSATAPARLDLGGFLFVSGDVTLTLGGPDKVDVDTGLEGVSSIPQAIQDIQVAADKLAAGGELRRSEDFTKLWNVGVSSLQFGFTNGTAFVGGGFPGDTDGVITKAEVEAAGAFGLFATGVNLAFVLLTPLGATPLATRFLGMKGKIGSFDLVGLGDFFSLSLSGIEIQANHGQQIVSGEGQAAVVDWVSSFPDPDLTDDPEDATVPDPTPQGYRIFIGGLDPPALYLDSTGSTIGFSADRAVLSIGSVVHIAGRFALEQGAIQKVDVEIEDLDQTLVDEIRGQISSNTASEDPEAGTLATNEDGSMIWNLPVSTMLLGISDGSVFVGYNPGGFPDASSLDLPLAADDLAEGAIGLLGSGITMGLVLATPLTGTGSFAAASKFQSFLAVRADIASFTIPGLPTDIIDFYLEGIRLEVNRASTVTGDTDAKANVDWAASFPDDENPGLPVATGGEDVVIDFEDPVIAVRADLAVLSISNFIHVSGGFSLEFGGDEEVVVKTGGLTSSQGTALGTAVNGMGGDLAAEADGSEITGLSVNTILIGISNANFFVGYEPTHEDGTKFQLDESGTLVLSEDAVGLVATGINVGLVLATVDAGAVTGYRFSQFYALRAEVGLLEPVGIPEDIFKLSFEQIVLEVNGGGVITKNGVPLTQAAPSAPATSTAWIDWEASFPDPNDDETDPPAGLAVPTGTTTEPVYIDFADPVTGISAGRVTLAISNFVFIQGGFAFRKGERHLLNVRTSGLNAGAATALGNAIPGSPVETDPGDTLGHNAGTSTIWNLPVITTTFGISNAAIFIGYNPDPTRDDPTNASYDPAKRFSVDEDGNLVLSPDAIGFAASGIQVGMVFATAEEGVIAGYGFSTFIGVSAYIGSVDILGLPDELGIELKGIKLSVNTGGAIRTGTAPGTPIVGSKAVVDWLSSFPDPDGADNPLTDDGDDSTTDDVEGGPLKGGLAVPTGEGNDPVYIDFRGQLIGLSASLVTLSISDFVYIRGGFSFEKGGNTYLDVRTSGLTSGSGLATSLNGVGNPGGFDEDPEGNQTRATQNASTIWDVPMLTTMIGISNASIFVGYNPNQPGTEGTSFNTGDDGLLDEDDLSEGAIGLLANGINVGIVIAKVSPDAPAALRAGGTSALPTFMAVAAEVALLTPVGLPEELVFRFEDIGLSVNKGGKVGTVATSNSWVDWASSFPEELNEDDSVAKPAGLLVPTGTGNIPVLIDFEDPIIGISAGRVVISIYNFVHISGGFAFEKGGQETVTINTGLVLLGPDAAACGVLATAATTAGLAGEDVELSEDCSTLTGATVETIKVGVYRASVFVGYNPNPECPEGETTCPVFDTGENGVLDPAELSPAAIGFLGSDINLGFVFATLVRGAFTSALGEGKAPKFYAIKAHVADMGLVGVPGIILNAKGATVEVNAASKWTGGEGANSPPSIDWTSLSEEGLEIPTGGDNPPVHLDFEGFIIGGGVNQFTLQISEFVYLAGRFYFEYGTVRTMPLTNGIIDASLLTDLLGAVSPEVTAAIGATEKELQFLTIGAQDVHAFVGLGGPYWVDADGDGEIDRYTSGPKTGQIIDEEVNAEAVGLVLDDVDFAMAMMTPTNRLDPIRYISLKASAAKVALVGIDGLVADARNLIVELNISTPTLYGLPVLPVVDFASWDDDDSTAGVQPFAVKVGAPAEFGGDPVVVPFTFGTALIRASGQFNLNVFGVLALSGSLAFRLGETVDATLADSGHTVVNNVVTMTIGGSNLLGFVGYVPDSGSAWELNSDGTVHWVDEDGADCTPSMSVDCEIVKNPDAVGLLINDLDFGIFVGVKTPSTTDVSAGVFVATSIVIDDFGLIGVPGITALGTLAIMLNLGLALGQTSAVGGIDFTRTYTYDPDREPEESEGADGSTSLCTTENPSTAEDPNCDDLPGLKLDTGDPDNPILIDFDTTFVSVSLAGVLNIVDFVQALGVFYLEVDGQGLKMLADAQLLIGPDKISDPTAANVSGNHGTGVSPILEIGALGVLIINGDGIAADLDVDFSLNVPGISVAASARILFNSTGDPQVVEIPERLYQFISDQATPGSLAQELLDRIPACDEQPEGATSTIHCYEIGDTAPDLGNSTTVYNLLHNPSGPITTSGSPGAYVVVLLDGSFDFLGFAEAKGLAGVRISGDVFQLVFDLHFSIGFEGAGLDFDSSGFVEINPQGLLLDIAVSINADVTSLFHFDVSGHLKIKTYGPDKHFILDLSGRLDVLGIFSVNGSLNVTVANNAWSVSVSASGHFGPVTISGSGTIRSDGTFDLSFTAGLQIGPDVVHIGGTVSLHIFMQNTRASNGAVCNADDTTITDCGIANHGALRFGFELTGSAEACAFGVCLGISVSVILDGVISGDPNSPSYLDVKVRGCVDLLLGDVCATIKVATIRLPGSILPENDPKLAELQGVTLVLNVGDRGDERLVSPTETVEDYQVVVLSVEDNGTYTVQVNAFGRSQVFKGVSAITGDFGDGNDVFTLVNGAVPVTISGGDGSDTLISNGSGVATFNGNAGADMLVGGSAADVLNGGAGNDYLEGRGGIDQLNGGGERRRLRGPHRRRVQRVAAGRRWRRHLRDHRHHRRRRLRGLGERRRADRELLRVGRRRQDPQPVRLREGRAPGQPGRRRGHGERQPRRGRPAGADPRAHRAHLRQRGRHDRAQPHERRRHRWRHRRHGPAGVLAGEAACRGHHRVPDVCWGDGAADDGLVAGRLQPPAPGGLRRHGRRPLHPERSGG